MSSHLTEYIRAGHVEPLSERADQLDYTDGFYEQATLLRVGREDAGPPSDDG